METQASILRKRPEGEARAAEAIEPDEEPDVCPGEGHDGNDGESEEWQQHDRRDSAIDLPRAVARRRDDQPDSESGPTTSHRRNGASDSVLRIIRCSTS